MCIRDSVKTVKQNFFLAEEQTNYLTYEHQYTRFDEIGATEGTSERPSVMTFYLRSSLYIEKNTLSPDLKADEMLSAIGGSWGFFELLALAAMLAISLLIKCAGLKAPNTTTTEAEAVDSEQKADTAEIRPWSRSLRKWTPSKRSRRSSPRTASPLIPRPSKRSRSSRTRTASQLILRPPIRG